MKLVSEFGRALHDPVRGVPARVAAYGVNVSGYYEIVSKVTRALNIRGDLRLAFLAAMREPARDLCP